jgi:hypothetical protein
MIRALLIAAPLVLVHGDFWLCEREVPKCLFTPEGSS